MHNYNIIILLCNISDLHRSVAATVVEMFTGRTPYTCEKEEDMTVFQLLMKICTGGNPMHTPAMQKSLANGKVPPDLEELLNACFKP